MIRGTWQLPDAIQLYVEAVFVEVASFDWERWREPTSVGCSHYVCAHSAQDHMTKIEQILRQLWSAGKQTQDKITNFAQLCKQQHQEISTSKHAHFYKKAVLTA